MKLHYFLSQNKQVGADILVLEGWLPDYALEKGIQIFREGNYKLLITTGGPLTKGYHLSRYKTSAELAEAILLEAGFKQEFLISVPAPFVIRDRTYESAIALKKWMEQEKKNDLKIDLVSLSVHSRRSRFLFQKAFGKDFLVGIISVQDRSYDSKKWWKYSGGFRSVLDESIAYFYAKFIF